MFCVRCQTFKEFRMMRKTCINLRGDIIQELLPSTFTFHDQHPLAFESYNKYKDDENLHVVTLVDNGAAIGYCAYFFAASVDITTYISVVVESVFIQKSYRDKHLSNLLAKYASFDLKKFSKSITQDISQCRFINHSDTISNEGKRFSERVIKLASVI